jgi:hypothetical protein
MVFSYRGGIDTVADTPMEHPPGESIEGGEHIPDGRSIAAKQSQFTVTGYFAARFTLPPFGTVSLPVGYAFLEPPGG